MLVEKTRRGMYWIAITTGYNGNNTITTNFENGLDRGNQVQVTSLPLFVGCAV
jgi:hypothetical protein